MKIIPEQINEFINNRSLKERLLIFIAVILLIFFVWNFAFNHSMQKQKNLVRQQINTKRLAIAALNEQKQIFLERINGLPKSQLMSKQVKLSQNLEFLTKEIGDITSKQLSGQEFTAIVQKEVINVGNLQLLKVKTIPMSEPNAKGIIKFQTTLELQGRYQDIYEFVANMEKLPWQIFWDELEYRVTKYPEAKVTIQLHTIGIFG